MNVWHRHNGRGTAPLVQVLVCFSLSLSELCAKNGQSLCARQNFNKGSKEVEVVVKEGEERWR